VYFHFVYWIVVQNRISEKERKGRVYIGNIIIILFYYYLAVVSILLNLLILGELQDIGMKKWGYSKLIFGYDNTLSGCSKHKGIKTHPSHRP